MINIEDWDRPVRLTTGGEEEIEIIRLRDRFFEHVSKSLGFISLGFQDNPFIDLQTSELQTLHSGDERTHSDDYVHQMVVCNELIAMVFDRRNDGNYHEVTFWNRLPSEMVARHIQERVDILNNR